MSRGRKTKIWTEENLQFLRDNYATMPNNKIAAKLGISRVYVSNKAKQLGLSKESSCWKLTMQVKEKIIGLYPNNSYKSIANMLNISDSAVYKYIKELACESESFRKRSANATGVIIAAERKKLIIQERVRMVMGERQKSRVHILVEKRKSRIRALLRQTGGYEVGHGSKDVYVIDRSKRNKELELKAKSTGLVFHKKK